MSRIRKLFWFDKKSSEEMISFLNDKAADKYINHIMFNPFIFLHHLLPLKLKFLPESYILENDKKAKGLITVAPTTGKEKKVKIQKLLFEEGSFLEASELIQFVTAKYKALGAFSITVKVDDYLPELLTMLVSKCNFSQISYEKLWKIDKFINKEFDKQDFRVFRNSDARALVNAYNNSILPHFRPLLSADVSDFKENPFKGLSYYSEYKYIYENPKKTNPITGIIIKTYDNENFIIDIIQPLGAEIDIDTIISYTTYQIKKRKKRFALFVRTKRYTQLGEQQEQYFLKEGFECVQNQALLTNTSAKILKEEIKSGKYTIIGDFCPSKIMPV